MIMNTEAGRCVCTWNEFCIEVEGVRLKKFVHTCMLHVRYSLLSFSRSKGIMRKELLSSLYHRASFNILYKQKISIC